MEPLRIISSAEEMSGCEAPCSRAPCQQGKLIRSKLDCLKYSRVCLAVILEHLRASKPWGHPDPAGDSDHRQYDGHFR